MAKYKRFCCWCGKVEYTKTCKSKSLNKVIDKIIKNMKTNFKQFNK